MPAVDDLQGEFSGPVAYDGRWFWLALLGIALVVLYYAAVLVLTRRRARPPDEDAVTAARREHLERIDRIEAAVRSGGLPARDGHQQLSEAVRSYVGTVSPLPAPTMALADFRARAPRPLTDAIELMYPPEFAPDDVGRARERFDDAVREARGLVATWA
ncbi:hypothetical protein [Nocardioides sp. TF02-7]|uniref:hypothetical protein n=1 Tax=Nocardioides sp. TF02-7 TaxID=2917724 RepID=UPI001F05C644|nr:hypothetical protein [Nocardioides sp. TF02-7]UMG93447.1 hypothetical protein MF408_04230 [Nocardioides sp. TF02-7]